MKSLGPVVDEAIPHEAGHLLLGRVVGIPTRGLDVEVVRYEGNMISVGNFATLTYEPPDEEIPRLEPKVRASYMLFVAGGLAGQKFEGRTSTAGIEQDRKQLARLKTDKTLEELAEMGVPIIQGHRRVFRQLMSLIRQRYMDLMKHQELQTGRYHLLIEEDLDAIFAQKKGWVPPERPLAGPG
jgi:hypothetical protein